MCVVSRELPVDSRIIVVASSLHTATSARSVVASGMRRSRRSVDGVLKVNVLAVLLDPVFDPVRLLGRKSTKQRRCIELRLWIAVCRVRSNTRRGRSGVLA